MKKTKVSILLIVISLVISSFSGIAFADQAAGSSASTIDPLTAPLPSTDIKPVSTEITLPSEPNEKITEASEPALTALPAEDKTKPVDPLRQALKDKIAQLTNLRTQESQIRATLKNQTQSNGTLIKSIKSSLDGIAKQNAASYKDQITTLKKDIESLRTQVKTLTAQIKSTKGTGNKDEIAGLNNQIKTLKAQMQEAKKSKNKDLTASLQAQISSISSQIKSLKEKTNNDSKAAIQTQIKGITQQIKDKLALIKSMGTAHKQDSTAIQALKEKIKKGFADIKPIQDSQKTIFTEIKAINEKKANEFTQYNAAVKAKDFASANTHMDNILSLKQQVISKLNDVGPLKTQINEKLTALSAALKL